MPLLRPEEGLLALQQSFLDDLLGRRPLGPEARDRVFRTPPEGSVDDRWEVYAHGYVLRVVEALENDFPALRRVLGPGPFAGLVERYLGACPPRSHDLGRAGDRLAAYLGDDPLTRELPFLPDLARLEWCLAESFVAAETAALTWEQITALGPEPAAELPLALSPGTFLVRSSWPLVDIWACRNLPDAEVSVPLEGRPSSVLVRRDGLAVDCRAVDEREARLLESAARGACLADALSVADEDEAAALVESFRRLVEERVFRVDRPPETPAAL